MSLALREWETSQTKFLSVRRFHPAGGRQMLTQLTVKHVAVDQETRRGEKAGSVRRKERRWKGQAGFLLEGICSGLEGTKTEAPEAFHSRPVFHRWFYNG